MMPSIPTEETPPLPVRRIRWRIIPAGLNWGLGGIFIVCVPLIMVVRWKDLILRPDGSSRPSFVAMVVLALVGTLLIVAGGKWLKGKWWLAVVLDVTAYCTLGAIDLYETSLRKQTIEQRKLMIQDAKRAREQYEPLHR